MADFPMSPRYSFRVNLKSPDETRRSNEKSSKQKKLSTKERYNRYRRRLQQDNDAYTKLKKTDALKKRIFRKNLVGEQLETYNEKAKMRMRAYRLRQKEKGVVEKPATRKSIAKLRDYWREKKKQHRSKMTPEAKDREREKRRQRYKSSKPVEPKDKTPQKSNYIPRNPEKFAKIIQNAVQTATPRKKTALFKTGLFDSAKKNETLKNETNAKIVARVKRALNNLKRQKTKVGRSHYQLLTRSIVGKYAVEHSLRKALDMKWEHWMRMSEIEKNGGPESSKRIDALADESVQNIERYYEYESVTLPMKKTVSGKTLKQKKVLTETLPQVHKRFLQDHPKLKVSLGHFRKLRPKEVLTVHKQKFASCLCEYCLNVQFKIDVINRAMKTHKLDCTIESKFHAVNISLCEKKEVFHDRQCVERECDACGKEQVKEYLKPLVEADNTCTYVWKKWKMGTVGSGSGKDVKRQVLAEESGTVSELVDEFADAVDFLASHLFVARWQYDQFNNLSKSVPEGVVLTIADFAENYRCVHQDEIQSAYYNYNQATVFPMLGYYRCPDCKDAIVQESAVFITPDLTHDSVAASQFSKTMSEHVQGHVQFSSEVQFSDGSASQFKSKVPFLNVSETNTHTMERAYFGSRHGKSPCDALGGLVKKKAELHVKSRKGTIQHAKQLFDYCKEHLTMHEGSKCEHKRRVFFYQESINREQPKKKVQTIKGTRKLHSVRGVEPGVVKTRHLSCFCHVCLGDEKGNCPNEKYVGQWQTQSLFKGDKKSKQQTDKKGGKGKTKQTKNEVGKKNKSQTEPRKEQSVDKDQLNISDCSTMKDLRYVTAKKRFNPLPQNTTKTFCNTAKTVDKNSMPLLPSDIPKGFHSAVIQGDGNCLPRSASLLAYGTEDHHEEMRHRIVCEMVQNEELYLDNKYLKNGMNPNENVDVAKTFASYSSLYMGTRLNKKSIRELYEQEALSIGKNGTYMGMWQLASLPNILSCPVVSVYPEYGSRTVRNDMHRVLYPVKREHSENERVYIMWTNSNGALVPEKEFSVNHFVVLMQLTTNSTNAFDLDCSFDDVHDSSMTLEDDSYDVILDVLNHLDVDMEVSEEITSISDENRHSASKHTAQQSPSDHNEMSPSDHIEMSPSDHIEMSPSDHIEMSPSDHNDLFPSDHIEMSPSDHIEMSPSDQNDLSPSDQNDLSPSYHIEMSPSDHIEDTSDHIEMSPNGHIEMSPSDQTEMTPRDQTEMSLSDHIEMSLSDHIENPIDQTEQPTRQETKTSFSEPEQHPSNQTGQPLSNQTGQPSSNQTWQSPSNQTGQSPSNQTGQSPTDDIEISPISSDQTEQPTCQETKTSFSEPEQHPSNQTGQPLSNQTGQSASNQTGQSASNQTRQSPSNQTGQSPTDDIEMSPISSHQTEQPTCQETKTSFSEPEQHPSNQTGQPLSNQTGQSASNQTGQSASNKTRQSPSNQTGQSPTDDIEISPISSHQTEQPTCQETKTSFSEPEQPPSNQTGHPPSNQTGQSASDEIEMLPSAETVQTLNAVTRQPQSLDTEQLVRFRSGDYVLIKYGRSFLPGVVDEWPWVTFFKKYRTYTWVMNDIKHTILESDVQKKLEPPDVSMQGRRLLYTFDGLQ